MHMVIVRAVKNLIYVLTVSCRWIARSYQDKRATSSVGTKPSFLGMQFPSILWLELLNANDSHPYYRDAITSYRRFCFHQ